LGLRPRRTFSRTKKQHVLNVKWPTSDYNNTCASVIFLLALSSPSPSLFYFKWLKWSRIFHLVSLFYLKIVVCIKIRRLTSLLTTTSTLMGNYAEAKKLHSPAENKKQKNKRLQRWQRNKCFIAKLLLFLLFSSKSLDSGQK
jgi:hypothetical protein